MQIEYDNKKRLVNIKKHGLDLSEFPVVFGSQIYTERDPYRGEKRWRVYGYVNGAMVCAVYTMRHNKPYAKNHRVCSIRIVGTDGRQEIEEKAAKKRIKRLEKQGRMAR